MVPKNKQQPLVNALAQLVISLLSTSIGFVVPDFLARWRCILPYRCFHRKIFLFEFKGSLTSHSLIYISIRMDVERLMDSFIFLFQYVVCRNHFSNI